MLVALLATIVGLYGCIGGTSTLGARLPKASRFVEEWRHYERLQPMKAMAVAGDLEALFVSGYAFGYADEPAAVNAAMADCEARRIDRRVMAPCRTYAVGDRLVDAAAVAPVSKR